jgi:hypothetical protein
MKSLSVRWGIILFTIGLIIFNNVEVWGADWNFYGLERQSLSIDRKATGQRTI